MRIVFSPEVRGYLKDVSEILYEKEYFGFEEHAYNYIVDLVHDIMDSLPSKVKKKASVYFSRYGKDLYYAVFKKNDNTQWYVFFNCEDEIYYVRYIGNNHTCAQYL